MSGIEKQPRVAKVLDAYKVILNVGARDGVEIDDEFVLYRIGEDVIDPETDESLGAYEELLGHGRITHVQEAISTLESTDVRTSARKVIRKFSPSASLSALVGLAGVGYGAPSEEIIENGEDEVRPFRNVQVGIFARMVSE